MDEKEKEEAAIVLILGAILLYIALGSALFGCVGYGVAHFILRIL
jgi:hypothetical protein